MLTVLTRLVRLRGEAMISINFRDSRPIYEQVKDALRRLIVSGSALSGREAAQRARARRAARNQPQHHPARLPRARAPRAISYPIPGKGSFARAQSGVESGRAKELLAIFDDAAEELLYLGVTPGQLKARIDGKGAGGDEN